MTSFSSAERWSGNPEPTNMRRSHRMGAPPKPVPIGAELEWAMTQKWFGARHGFRTLSRHPLRVNVINTLEDSSK
jgi:hypothetical protein